jgi:hypothetical protein
MEKETPIELKDDDVISLIFTKTIGSDSAVSNIGYKFHYVEDENEEPRFKLDMNWGNRNHKQSGDSSTEDEKEEIELPQNPISAKRKGTKEDNVTVKKVKSEEPLKEEQKSDEEQPLVKSNQIIKREDEQKKDRIVEPKQQKAC